ncbi:hypothetical protein TSOC_006095 [Tetrabaena socialis]|uniref:Uncharacterized protein n=1 Tax=Tetrabaena socialis TaxID=47790 RepID=A0A2J8A4K6_9CHLO|nr:hypothetical protein TSOC_006095 [Tetrabaena socialis]|eukprot:PNH07450.1 hypothetical protein TSOC_006095 [Tetrabaena socialis]
MSGKARVGGQALQNSAYTFFGEMRKEVGFDAAAVIERRGIDLHYSEFGMGGGSSPTGTAAARDPAAAARTPFYGVWGAYNGATDPWAPPELGASCNQPQQLLQRLH